jgi:hypothetical protein
MKVFEDGHSKLIINTVVNLHLLSNMASFFNSRRFCVHRRHVVLFFTSFYSFIVFNKTQNNENHLNQFKLSKNESYKKSLKYI